MLIRPTAFTIGLIIRFSIALFYVYTEFGIDSYIPNQPNCSTNLANASFPCLSLLNTPASSSTCSKTLPTS